MSKAKAREIFGEENVNTWRMSYESGPPQISEYDVRHPKFDKEYDGISSSELPTGESLKMCIDRIQDSWIQKIIPDIKSGKNILIVSHNNSIRALLKLIKQIPISECEKIKIPNAIP